MRKEPHLYLAFVVLLSLCFCGRTALGQTTSGQTTNGIKPKIIVIPKVKDGENLKTVYDSDPNIRVAMAKIDEAFLLRGANLISFDAKLKEAEQNRLINQSSGNQTDYKSTVLANAGSDIYVEAEINVVKHTQSNANSVSVILEAYQAGTSNYLGVKEGRSRINRTEDIGLLTAQAMDTITEPFLALMQLKFDDIVANGQSVYVQFSLADNSKYTFDSEIGNPPKYLSEVLDEWFQKNAVKGQFNDQGVSGKLLIVSDVHIPLKNPNNPQANYTGVNFFYDLNRFLQSQGVKARREIGTNNKILITIL
jgi:hypothetical protein